MRTISLDVSKEAGPRDMVWQVCVGSGHAYMGLRADWQEQLRRVHDECGFEFLRFHGLLCDDMGVYLRDADGNVSYNFQRVDKLYDAILAAGAKPFVELSFMPYDMASGEKTVFWWKANVTPPAEMNAWEELVRQLTLHLTDRYGREEVASWYFEVWNEPDHPAFFSAGRDEYFAMYAAAAKAIHSICEDYRVGGPATANAIWIPELIEFCDENDLPLHFITYHAYGLTSGHFDEFGLDDVILDSDPNSILKVFHRVKEEVAASSRPDLEIHVTEWSLSYSSRDPVHDHYVSAPYILHKLKRMEGLADSMSYWTFSDVFEETGPPPAAFHGGFGLLNCQNLAKPSFHAYRFLSALGGRELVCDDADAWATGDDGGVELLVWDYSYIEQDTANKAFFVKDVPTGPAQPTAVMVAGLAAGEYELTVQRVGYRAGDVQAAYRDMGCPNSPTPAECDKLAEAAEPQITCSSVCVEAGKLLEISLDIRPNDVLLMTLKRR